MQRNCRGTSVSKVAGVWRSLFWCLESVMLWRDIMGFTRFGDKRVNDLDLLSRLCSWSCMLAPRKSMHADLHVARLDHLFFTCHFCLQCFVPLPSAVFSHVQTPNKPC